MRTNRKTAEKKMSMNKNIARLAVTAGLTAALSFGGVMAPVTMAFAEGATASTNSIKINKNEDNGSVKYKAYQIFEADVVDEADKTDKVVSNVKWATGVEDATQNAIIGAINKYKEGALKTDASPQDVANWLTANIIGTTNTTVLKDTDLLNTLAGLVAKNVAPTIPTGATEASFAAGNKVSFDKSGYYLFLTDKDTLAPDGSEADNKNTATSPIYAVVGAGDVVVTEKTSIPTVVKKVKNDGGSNWADKADSQMGQKVEYKLTGTVASNIATFDTYHYEFSDKLSDGLTADANSVIVKIGDTILSPNTTPGAKTGYDVSIDATNTLTVKFADLKTAAEQANAALDGSSNVVVTYTAMLDPTKATNVTVGGTGNDNAVKLIYSNNPMGEGTGESVPDTVRDYTYALKLIKQDADSDTKIDNVEFTIQATDPDDVGSKDMYVGSEGTLVNEAYKFKTANGGKINVKGLDAGTYTVHEVEGSNPGYNTLDDFTFTIKPEGLNKDEGVALDEKTAVNTLKVTVQKPDSATMVTPSVDGGTVTLTVKNKKGSNLPLTGLNGVTFTWIAGGAVLCIGVAHLIRSRKQAEESEQE